VQINMTVIIINIFAILGISFSFYKNKQKSLKALKVALKGAILMIPSLVAFPLTASLVNSGASISVAAAFITTLTMIGFVTLPMEIKELGKRLTLLRNGISFIIAIGIALIMGVLI
jgi:uncharacterized membrane protein YraQ (UPF0718 family)